MGYNILMDINPKQVASTQASAGDQGGNRSRNPDIQAEVSHQPTSGQVRGKLKLFLGYAAGVGKTFAMLKSAQQCRSDGLDVVIGHVDTHNQPETEELLIGLEIIPGKPIEHRGFSQMEIDVDAILNRHPRLVLVDDLAHTNTPGSRHPKRYQDVQELLSAGIDIYATINIQYFESFNDVVTQITGAYVRETIPDKIIDDAADIELIDITPEELLKRLAHGKVNVQAENKAGFVDFFREGNLTALREITMRRAAEHVDHQMRAYMQTRAIPGPWQATERLMVCISPNVPGEHLVRSARRLADELKAEWFVVYVETPEHEHLSQNMLSQVGRSMRLAEELGARTKTLPTSPTASTDRKSTRLNSSH